VGLTCRFRFRPSAFRMTIACSDVGSSNSRKQPSSSPSCVSSQNDSRVCRLDHFLGVPAAQWINQPSLAPRL